MNTSSSRLINEPTNGPTTDLVIKEFPISEIRATDALLKQLKQLSRKATGEQLKMFYKDQIIIALYNKKIIGMCCISDESPLKHFENEKTAKVPYLYNYICDISHKKRKPSVAIMNYIKQKYMLEGKNLINLNIEKNNTRAVKFFERNGFIECGEYNQSIKSYFKYTADLLQIEV